MELTHPVESEQAIEEAIDYERLLVHEWRASQLERVGIPKCLADVVADWIDWHEIAALVERGCSPRLALDIVR
jgi:hypothetical protein